MVVVNLVVVRSYQNTTPQHPTPTSCTDTGRCAFTLGIKALYPAAWWPPPCPCACWWGGCRWDREVAAIPPSGTPRASTRALYKGIEPVEGLVKIPGGRVKNPSETRYRASAPPR